ncbi:twin-arginine translocation signal domain-containing protein [Haloferax sp. DFSO60]|uniref:twin-arginine translocation signal domain-containing protein n=1 Tax=Haloferax sp. DFSO60 TaxID=3388652 RepID=UPI0039782E83
MPSRRQFLKASAGLGATLGFAGCLSSLSPSQDGDVDENETTETATKTPSVEGLPFGAETTINGVTVTPKNVHPQATLFYSKYDDPYEHDDPYALERLGDEWVVFVNINAYADSGPTPPRDAFELVAGDETFAALESVADTPLERLIPDEAITTDAYDATPKVTGWLVFTVPVAFDSASDLSLQFTQDETVVKWDLPADAKARIGSERPTFELDAFDVPEQVVRGNATEVSLSVRNTASVDGVFRAVVRMTNGEPHRDSRKRVELPIEASTEATATVELDSSKYSGSRSTETCYLQAVGIERERTVEVVLESNDS